MFTCDNVYLESNANGVLSDNVLAIVNTIFLLVNIVASDMSGNSISLKSFYCVIRFRPLSFTLSIKSSGLLGCGTLPNGL